MCTAIYNNNVKIIFFAAMMDAAKNQKWFKPVTVCPPSAVIQISKYFYDV